MTCLLALERGREALIERLEVEAEDGGLLRAMGLLEGQVVRVLRRAPLGGPLQVRVGEACFALGRALAERVHVGAVSGERP